MKQNKKKLMFSVVTLSTVALSASILLTSQSTTLGFAKKLEAYSVENDLANGGKFGADFNSFDEAHEAARDVNKRLSEEGSVVLKNDGSLPFLAGSKVSLFGIAQVSGASSSDSGTSTGTVSIKEGLEEAGFDVNGTLANYYSTTTSRSEVSSFPLTVSNSIDMYDDLGVVLLSRSGGEGSDLETVTNEDSDPGEHENEVTGKKHYLETTKAEEELIALAEKRCKKVVVVLNSSYVMEMGTLNDDAKVNGIVWVGLTGETGMLALGEILAGNVNPSGHTCDIWARDFTKDPTWNNFGSFAQTGYVGGDVYYYPDGAAAGSGESEGFGYPGYHGVDYEEGIYLGYKYYETRYKAIYDSLGVEKADQWYAENVVYPFGYGTSYTKFKFETAGIYTDSALKSALPATVDGTDFASAVGSQANVKSLYVPVTVTNTGNKAGKEVVQIYVNAPYTKGGVAKSFVVLAGFEKTGMLQPGASETVIVKLNVQDFASYDFDDSNKNDNKGYELDAGTYTLYIQDSSHVELSDNWGDKPHAKASFTIANTGNKPVNLKLDDYSGKVIENEFSDENGMYNSFREGVNNKADDAAGADPMTVLSRDDMGVMSDADVVSFPKAPTKESMTISWDLVDMIIKYDGFDADNTARYADADVKTTDFGKEAGWAEEVTIPANWTQADTTPTKTKIQLADMAGVDRDDPKWDTFMNQLSWEQISYDLQHGGYATPLDESIGKIKGVDADGPGNLNNTYGWCDEPIIASTWNRDLAKEEGIVVANLGMFKGVDGWYGPGADIHRSPFSGRNGQYYSQDGFHGGEMGAAVVSGAESRGMICYIKHFVSNDQETSRDGEVHFTWQTEQALRENQLQQFKIPMQEGNASGAMTAFARIGAVPSSANYNLLTKVVRDEWDWKGYFVTDGYNGTERCASMDLMVRTGQDMPLGNTGTSGYPTIYDWDILLDYDAANKTKTTYKSPRSLSGEWDATQKCVVVGGTALENYTKVENRKYTVASYTPAKVRNDAQWYFARKCLTNMMYNWANSTTNRNGTAVSQYVNKDLGTVAQGSAVSNLSIAADKTVLNGSSASYAITSGELPDGLTLNRDGSITGTPSGTPGTYKFTVKISIEEWITSTAEFTITTTTPFYTKGDDPTKAKVGEDFAVYVQSDTVQTKITGSMAMPGGGQVDIGTTVTYGLADDSVLPDGLTIGDNGLIEGTPTKAGTYDFTVKVTAVTSGGWGAGSTVVYYYPMSITVAGSGTTDPSTPSGEKTTEEQIADLEKQISDLEKKIEAGSSTTTDTSALEKEIQDLKDEIAALKKGTSSGGCGGSVIAATSAIAAVAVLGAGLLLKKKKDEEDK